MYTLYNKHFPPKHTQTLFKLINQPPINKKSMPLLNKITKQALLNISIYKSNYRYRA